MKAAIRWALVVAAVVGLAIDAYTHLHLAGLYDPIRTPTISQGTLFRIEGALAIVAAVGLVVRANRWTALLAVAVAGGGLAALLIYRYVNVGTIGPLPNMYEPIWYHDKQLSAAGELLAMVAGLALVALTWPRRVTRAVRPRAVTLDA